MAARDTDCLVVGAGPSGLFAAIALRRHGVACRIVDRAAGPADEARATAVRVRSLEILARLGLLDGFLAAGVVLRGARIYANRDALVAETSTDGVESPYPFDLSLPQSRTERLLIAELERLGSPVERDTELVSFTQAADGVAAVLRRGDGSEARVACGWLIGCDGAHSTVRHGLGMDLRGTDDPAVYAVADVRAAGPLARDKSTLFAAPEVGVLLSPLPDDRFVMFRDFAAPATAPADGRPTLADMQASLDRAGPGGIVLRDPAWLAWFHCHSRLAPRYRDGSVFLVGDAAHVQSPAAGQGMNTGLQDGWNLAWKIALVAQGRAPDALLDSYHAERHDIGRQMLALSDRTHRLVFEHHAGVAARARRSLAGFLAEHHVIHPPLRTADQTRVAYHRSPIVGESGAGPAGPAWYAAPRPGDRAPDGALADANGAPVRLFAATRAPVHHLLVFAGPAAGADVAAAHGFAATATAGCAAPIAPHLVVCGDAADTATGDAILRDPGGALHARYGAAAACAYLLRPDGHVGWRSPTLDAAALRRYLGAVFG